MNIRSIKPRDAELWRALRQLVVAGVVLPQERLLITTRLLDRRRIRRLWRAARNPYASKEKT